jgi:hypothetical protein
MFGYPFRDRAVADRYAEGLLKAGVPPGSMSGGYLPAFKGNQLTGQEIRTLLFGSTITGIHFISGSMKLRDGGLTGKRTEKRFRF